MRINLNVPFAQKEQAKGHGAKWDAGARTWYVQTDLVSPDQLSELERFIPAKALKINTIRVKTAARKRERLVTPRATTRTDLSLPDCGCSHVAPWDECDHVMALQVLDPDQLAHMRSIQMEM